MPPLRLFELPYVPLKEVLKLLDLFDLFDLSLCSKKASKIIKGIHPLTLDIDIKYLGQYKKIDVRVDDSEFYGSWDFGWESLAESQHEEMRSIEGHEFRYQKSVNWESNVNVYSHCSHPEITLKLVLSHLRAQFTCWFCDILLGTRNLEAPLTEYLTAVKICDNLTLEGRPNSIDDMRCILEIEVIERLTLLSDVDLECHVETLTFPTFEVLIEPASAWVTPNNFLNAKWENCFLLGGGFSMEVYELLVNNWLAGKYPRLTSARVIEEQELGELEVLKTRGVAWDPLRRGRYFIVNEDMAIDCAEEMDIVRSDGSVATIITKEQRFQMLVWNKRFHEPSYHDIVIYK